MRGIAIALGVLSLLGGLALGAYNLLGWVVTASTGVASGGQRASFYLLSGGAALAVVAGIGLIVFGIASRGPQAPS